MLEIHCPCRSTCMRGEGEISSSTAISHRRRCGGHLLPQRSRIKRDYGEGVEWNILLEMHASPEMPKDG